MERTDRELRAVLNDQARAWSAGDVDGFMRGYWHSDELEFITPAGTTRGWQATRDRYKAKYDTPEKMGKLEFADLHLVGRSGSEATLRGRYILHRENGPTDTGRFELLFRRIDGHWRIVLDQTVGDEAPATQSSSKPHDSDTSIARRRASKILGGDQRAQSG